MQKEKQISKGDFLETSVLNGNCTGYAPLSLKALQNLFFWLWRRDPVLELQVFTQLRVVLLRFASQHLEIAL